MNASQIARIDRQHIWHPYSSLTRPIPTYEVSRADGVRLQLADGRTLIDGMSSWWCAIHGYNHPALNSAIKKQVDDMAHVMFGGIIHQPAAGLAQRLVAITPEGLEKIFLCDSGSVSVEVAIKMAIQYWLSVGRPEKCQLLSLRNGYHGDTFGAMSVCDPITGMHHLFSKVLSQQIFAPAPGPGFDDDSGDNSAISEFEKLINRNADKLAAVILEPVCQGAGGMRFYSPRYLRQVRALCDQYDVLLIADEIATGFGRTGKLFACEWAGIAPDILCLGKALTGGYLSLAATLCTEKVSRGICEGEAGVLMHGPTFMANPLACAVANASIDLLLAQDWQANIARLQSRLQTGLAPARESSAVVEVRILGGIGVIELKLPVDLAVIQKQFVDKGVWIRPFGKLVYTMPPYCINDADLDFLCRQMVDVVTANGGTEALNSEAI